MTRRLKPLEPDDPRHGTMTGYHNHRCRCEACKAAWAAYYKAKSHQKGWAVPREVYVSERRAAIRCGTRGGYQTLGCRCEECRRWSREARKFWRDKAKQRAS